MNIIELEIPDQNIDIEGRWEPVILTETLKVQAKLNLTKK